MNPSPALILSTTAVAHFLVHAAMVLFPPLMLVIGSEFGVEFDTLGWIYAASNFLFGIGGLPSGWMQVRLGERRLLLLFLAGLALAATLVAFSRGLASLTASLILMGLFSSSYHPAGLTLISRHIPGSAEAMGYHGIAGTLGLAAAPGFAVWVANGLGWRYAYGIVGVVAAAAAVATFFALPQRVGSPTASDGNKGETRRVPLLIFYALSILIGLTFYGFKTYMPAHFAENAGDFLSSMDPMTRGGWLTSGVLLAGLVGQYLGGKIGDRYNKTGILPLIFLAHIPVLILFGTQTGWMLFVSGLALGFVHFSAQPVANVLVADFTSSQMRGVAYGIAFSLNFGLGSLASGFGGMIAVRHGLAAVFPTMSLFMGLAVVLGFWLHRAARRP